MEQPVIDFSIVVKDAFHVTTEIIKPVKAFVMKTKKYGSFVDTTWYLTDNGWMEASSWSIHREIAWTELEAHDLKRAKMEEHLNYLKNDKIRTEEKIAKMQEELQAPQKAD